MVGFGTGFVDCNGVNFLLSSIFALSTLLFSPAERNYISIETQKYASFY